MNTLLTNRTMNSLFRGRARALEFIARVLTIRIVAFRETLVSSLGTEKWYMSAERTRIVWPLTKPWQVFLGIVLLTAFYPLVVRAQTPNVQYTNKAIDLGLRGNLTVNPSTQALEIQIPLGDYAGRAGFNEPIAISYSSKVHRIKYEAYNPGHYSSSGVPLGAGYTMVSDRFAEYSS